MISRWSEKDARGFLTQHAKVRNKDLVLQTYASRLLGADPELVLYGGGNTSFKGHLPDVLGESVETLFIKPSGLAMASMMPDDFMALDLQSLLRLRRLKALPDEAMAQEFRKHFLKAQDGLPSVETLLHAFLGFTFLDHTHPAAILALTNRAGGERTVREALGKDIAVVPYVTAGFDLAVAAAKIIEQNPRCNGAVLMQHGLITWGKTAREAYKKTIGIVGRAEKYLAKKRTRPVAAKPATPVKQAQQRYAQAAPMLRGMLSIPSGNPDNPFHRVILRPLIDADTLRILDSRTGKSLALSSPLTPDYLIRTKAYPLLLDKPRFDDGKALRDQLIKAFAGYASCYKAYLKKYGAVADATSPANAWDVLPRVVLLPGLGAVCAGKDAGQAQIAADITRQALRVKTAIYETGGTYRGIAPDHLFAMEFHGFQRAKLSRIASQPLSGGIALVTGAAGAIGTAISQALLNEGCHVALADLAGSKLDATHSDLGARHGNRVLKIPMDVTDAASVSRGFQKIAETWGGLDLVVINAGIAHVSSIADMTVESFRRLEQVNTEGTLLALRESSRVFKMQNTGGDIVLISTKNVFSPGAQFGAYSATKAASHQLARIASLELAGLGVRVNMVAPDGVFSHGQKKSGLWAAVGPSRMRARGLDEKGLEEYYRQRNLLKVKITAGHVAKAVLFFATRQTPTTGATLPVDGGLPDATPR